MNERPLGRSGLSIAPLVLGTNVFGWNIDGPTSHAILDRFVDAGFNAVDTANSYSRWVPGHKGGESESVIGTWIKKGGKRDKIVIATKVGSDMGNGKGLAKAYVLRAAEESLKRLQTDRIDLYQSHFDDLKVAPEETLSAYAQLIKDGKVRAIGASNMKPDRLKESLAASARLGIPRYESLQPNYNLYDRKEYETDFEPVCVREGLGVIPYYSLAGGFLSGKYRTPADAKKNDARGGKVAGYLNARGLKILKALDVVAARHNAKPGQIAIAWLMAQPSITAPIASATSVAQLEETLAATRITLSADDLAVLDKASA
jgi:aryl-alcohol dehydrogenase-like predicted oxidoreductase